MAPREGTFVDMGRGGTIAKDYLGGVVAGAGFRLVFGHWSVWSGWDYAL